MKFRTFMVTGMMGLMALSVNAKKTKPVEAEKNAETSATVTMKPVNIVTFQDSLAYGIGVNLGNNLKRDSIMLDVEIIKAGINDAMKGLEPKLAKADVDKVFQKLSQQMQEKQMKEQQMAGEKNKVAGEKFLEMNKKNPDVKTTPTGLQYKVIKEGTGVKPTAADTVEVHYTGKLITGKVFDSSVERGETIKFPLNGVIPGWTEGLQLMTEGSKYELYIPSALGYGDRGAGGAIGPNEALIFEVELIKVMKSGK